MTTGRAAWTTAGAASTTRARRRAFIVRASPEQSRPSNNFGAVVQSFRLPPRSSLAIRVLGTYGGSAPGYRMTTFLIDGETALDAGALTESLPLATQARIRRVALTHAHFDHRSEERRVGKEGRSRWSPDQ